MATEVAEFGLLCHSLKDAMRCVEDGFTDTAIRVIMSLKDEVSVLVQELERHQKCLEKIAQSYRGQEKLVRMHVKVLEKKERELAISKSITDSKHRTQLKKLNYSKWELMKARNALYLYKRELTRTNPKDQKAVSELAEKMTGVQTIVDQLDSDCSKQNKSLQDTANKMTELSRKHSQALEKTKLFTEPLKENHSSAKKVDSALELTKKAVTLWKLCATGFDNGHRKIDVVNTIAKHFSQILTSSTSMPDICSDKLLKFSPPCSYCSQPMLNYSCGHCESHAKGTQMIKLLSFTYTDTGIGGTVSVENIAYDKKVLVRSTQDGWVHTTDRPAEYSSSQGSTDYFSFELKFDLNLSRCLEFALCYQVNKTEFWDNNSGRNYSISL